jgi:hypothetical protein
MPLMNDFRAVPDAVRPELVRKRDEFEGLFDELVRGLPLGRRVDRKIYRLMLLTLLNGLSTWYRPGRLTPREIGREVARVFRRGAEERVPKSARP